MSYDPFLRATTIARPFDRAEYDEGLRQHMLRVYNYMLAGLMLTGGTAYLTASSEAMISLFLLSPLKWVVMLAPLGFVMVLSFGINRLSAGAAQMVFWAYAAVMGLSLASIFLVFTGTSITRVFFITAAMFAGTSLYGYTTKADLSKFGGFLVMGLIGIVLAGLVNMFLGSSSLQFAISVIGVFVFVGLTAWDTQTIKEMYAESNGAEANQKLAIMGALSLYLNFVNLFMMLLQLLGAREE